MPPKSKRAAKKALTEVKKADVEKEDEDLEEMDEDELALIFPSTPFQTLDLKFAEN